MVDKKLSLRNPREFENPFFVVVHANPDKADRHLDSTFLNQVRSEIAEIKASHEFTEMNTWPPTRIPERVPKDRPILVCGLFYSRVNHPRLCVEDQCESLRQNGYDAHVSAKGTYQL